MAAAIENSRAAGQLGHRARKVRVPESMRFVVFQNNGGAHRWRLDADDGTTLARSGGFASFAGADQAAGCVGGGAASARLDRRRGEVRPVDLKARRDERSDGLDAERWLDEGGSFRGGPVAR